MRHKTINSDKSKLLKGIEMTPEEISETDKVIISEDWEKDEVGQRHFRHACLSPLPCCFFTHSPPIASFSPLSLALWPHLVYLFI